MLDAIELLRDMARSSPAGTLPFDLDALDKAALAACLVGGDELCPTAAMKAEAERVRRAMIEPEQEPPLDDAAEISPVSGARPSAPEIEPLTERDDSPAGAPTAMVEPGIQVREHDPPEPSPAERSAQAFLEVLDSPLVFNDVVHRYSAALDDP